MAYRQFGARSPWHNQPFLNVFSIPVLDSTFSFNFHSTSIRGTMNDSRSGVMCSTAADKAFGPSLACSQFDFTLTFEQTIFSIAFSSLLLIALPARIFGLYSSNRSRGNSPVLQLKIVGTNFYFRTIANYSRFLLLPYWASKLPSWLYGSSSPSRKSR